MEAQTLAEAGASQPPLAAVVESDNNEGSSSPKRRRKTRACDRCHRSGIKCSAGTVPEACGPCATYGANCTYDRPVKRRGPPPKNIEPHRRTPLPQGADHGHAGRDWAYQTVAPHHVIEELIAFYAAAIYPIQAYYHLPTLIDRVQVADYVHSRPFFVDLMSLCALTAARIRDGASLPSHPITKYMTSVPSEVFNQAAQDAFPTDLGAATEFEYKRAKSNMALLCIQYGDTRGLQRHLGDYCTLSAMDGFHLESRWPAGLSMIEVQERRRLFWATYQLDVYNSCTWGATVRHRESETTVLYPAEIISDDDVTVDTVRLPPSAAQSSSNRPGGVVSWVHGWNFVSDLYRILEHAIERVRIRRNGSGGAAVGPDEDGGTGMRGQGGPVSALYERGVGPAQTEILDLVRKMYAELPEELRVAAPLGDDDNRNRLGFQSTNIIITLQTLKMVVAGSGENSISQRCGIAGDLLDAISNVPTAYIYACSAPILHHLAGIGHLLIPLSQEPRSRTLNQWAYLQVRNCLLSMAEMLSGLESVLSRTAGIADRLRAHIERIDRVMEEAAKEREGRGVVHALRRTGSRAEEAGRPGGDGRGAKRGEAGRRGMSERQGESATRSTTTPLPPASASATASTSFHPDTSFHPNSTAGFDLSSIDFDALQPAHNAPYAGPPIDPVLLATLASAATGHTSEQLGGDPSANGNASGQVQYPGEMLQGEEDLFAGWPFNLGNAFEFLGSE